MLWLIGPLWNSVIPGGWSIQCEVFNYVLFALFKRIPLAFVIFATMISNIFFHLIATSHLAMSRTLSGDMFQAINRLNLTSSFSYFLIGIIINDTISKWQGFEYLRKSNVGLARKISFAGIFLYSITLAPIAFGNQYHCLLFIMASLALCFFIHLRNIRAKLLISLAKYSYSIYYTHFYILSGVFASNVLLPIRSPIKVFIVWGLLYSLTLGIGCSIGVVSWKYFELPISRRIRKLRN